MFPRLRERTLLYLKAFSLALRVHRILQVLCVQKKKCDCDVFEGRVCIFFSSGRVAPGPIKSEPKRPWKCAGKPRAIAGGIGCFLKFNA